MRLPWEASFRGAGRCLGTPFPAPFFTLLPALKEGRVGPWPLFYTGSQQGRGRGPLGPWRSSLGASLPLPPSGLQGRDTSPWLSRYYLELVTSDLDPE